ncbi:MAG: aminopeptidase N [Gammaproteobacteria bacterium]|nr:aminopeptidase N [Gammaproteobacteria bacterium]
MKHANPKTIYLKDYQQPDYWVLSVDLVFDLFDDYTDVVSVLQVKRNAGVTAEQPLVLDGENLELQSIEMNGQALSPDEFSQTDQQLSIFNVAASFELKVCVRIYPDKNTALEGLYRTRGNYCTQCESEGFRKITYYVDRPDNMALFTTKIIADKNNNSVLLSNGNLIDSGELDDGRHWVQWQDPHPKPSYLFALVAGQLEHVEDSFVTGSGRDVCLRVYVEAHNISKCDHAMQSLKKAMQWDEDRFGLQYDLDLYMIVAVDDFNMGAMENKGLNVFNSKYVLASPETATDCDYEGIEGVIGHEYFHNWTGNRVTCRDWFQLSLKEGLTVFRDQEFSSDMGSRAVKRIQEVRVLRTAQFPEDAGPMAHPIRPDSYIEINNFYTVTVYNKGAEVIRMIHTLLGEKGFRAGLDLYFKRHDGQAVTTDDFIAAMQDASGVDLTQFRRWYSQAGTPIVHVMGEYDALKKTYVLKCEQSCSATPKQAKKEPFHIPLSIALLDDAGQEVALDTEGNTAQIISLTEEQNCVVFENIPANVTPSLLRNFSAPVILYSDVDLDQLAFFAAHETDPFNRWDASQKLASLVIRDVVTQYQSGPHANEALHVDPRLYSAFAHTLNNTEQDPALIAEALQLPTLRYLMESYEVIDVDAISAAREFVKKSLANTLFDDCLSVYEKCQSEEKYQYEVSQVGKRSLKNTCLSYLVASGKQEGVERCKQQYFNANNMTDQYAAFSLIANTQSSCRDEVLQAFMSQWKDEALVVDKWFTAQAVATVGDTLADVKALEQHELFDIENPNRMRSLISVFAQGNPAHFHQASGDGYRYIADKIIQIEAKNPQIAARLSGVFLQWKRYVPELSELMREEIERVLAVDGLSNDVFEILSKSLQA